jgi:HEPN domain-containing protein
MISRLLAGTFRVVSTIPPFLAQQVGEKALKSLLCYLGIRRTAPFTPSLVEMMQEGEKR